jgi:hypothetical protein
VRWLIDEMLPPAIADLLTELGHDAVSVEAAGRRGAHDRELVELAVDERRCIVTENVADFASLVGERSRRGDACVPIVFVRKTAFGRGGRLVTRLAQHLHRWAEENPEPYAGVHWP